MASKAMKHKSMKTTLEVFVCNHDDCAEKGSKDLTSKLKQWSKERPDKDIKVFRSGCLGQCSDAMAIACYPQKELLINVKETDLKDIKQSLEATLAQLKS
jgi:NADH:ubiquinone oxidoreductase subunit E